ncbi:uncharacterized protein LOC111005508, partial [Momordica charantia]|uniref:Uncharacterized protein LOC111005508 n=1 Tax=Momordica charantia TaxID=3673 RepID=A0A6J1BUL5_MOMCH
MDRHNTKRARESLSASAASSDDAVSYERSYSSPPEIGNVKKQHTDGGGGQGATGRSSDLDVFDFPWLKDSLISKSEDWKFEDVFFTSLDSNGASTADDTLTIGTAFTELSGQLLWCDPGSLPDPYEAEAL